MLTFCFVCFSIQGNAQTDVGDVYLIPKMVEYTKTFQSGSCSSGACDARFSVKVNEGSRRGCFGYNGPMSPNNRIKGFKNLKNGSIHLGSFKLSDKLNIRFDTWANKGGGDWSYESSDLELPDVSKEVSLGNRYSESFQADKNGIIIDFTLYFQPKTCPAASQLENDILTELNLLRSNPKGYISILDGYANGKIKSDISSTLYKEVVDYLNGHQAVPTIKSEQCLFESAKRHAIEVSGIGNLTHDGLNGSEPHQRIKASCPGKGFLNVIGGENGYGGSNDNNVAAIYKTARHTILSWLIDEGIPSRGHRLAMMEKNVEYAGVGKEAGYTFINFATTKNTNTNTNIVRNLNSNSNTNTSTPSYGIPFGKEFEIRTFAPGTNDCKAFVKKTGQMNLDMVFKAEQSKDIDKFKIKEKGTSNNKKYYEISATYSGKEYCLDTSPGRYYTTIICIPCNNSASQQWSLIEDGTHKGRFRIVPKGGDKNGEAIRLSGGESMLEKYNESETFQRLYFKE